MLVRRFVQLTSAALICSLAPRAHAQVGHATSPEQNPAAATNGASQMPPPVTSSPATTPAPSPDGTPGPTPVPTAGKSTTPPPASPQESIFGDQPTGPITLDASVQLALARNHDVILAALNALQAQQTLYITRGVILPNLTFNAGAAANYTGAKPCKMTSTNLCLPTTVVVNGVSITQSASAASATSGEYNATLSFNQLVFDGGAWWNNLEAASLNFKQLKETEDEQRLQTTYQVTQAFLELVRAQKQLAVFGEAARRSRDQADFEEKLYNGGKAAQADVYAARSNRDNDEINRLTGEALVEQNRFALAILVGLDPSLSLTVVEPAELKDLPPAPPTSSTAVSSALNTRPSLRAFQHILESTQHATGGLRGVFYPRVSLNASYNRISQNFSVITHTPIDELSNQSAGVVISWNIFNGLADRAAVRRSELLELSNENDLQQGRRQVASDVNTAIANLVGARQRAQVAGQSEATAVEGLRLAKARQAVGVGTELDVRDAELKLTQAQLAHVNALVDGREQLAALKRAMGGDPSAVGTPATPGGPASEAQRNIGG